MHAYICFYLSFSHNKEPIQIKQICARLDFVAILLCSTIEQISGIVFKTTDLFCLRSAQAGVSFKG